MGQKITYSILLPSKFPVRDVEGKKKSQITSNLLLQETVEETVIEVRNLFIYLLDFNVKKKKQTTSFLPLG